MGTARSSVFLGRLAWAKPVSVNRLPTHWAENSFGSVSAACATKQKSADIAAPTSVQCRGASFRNCVAAERGILCSCSMRSTRSAPIFEVIPRVLYWRCWIRAKTTSLSIAISMCRSICRGIAAQVARGKTDHVTVTPDVVAGMLGPAKYVRETKLKTSKPGVVTGLAYTPAGGEVLHIEATRYPGKANIILTGHIGEVM